MSNASRVAILGVGYCLPDKIRGNDDPVFDWLREHPPSGGELFDGLKYRRVLERGDQITGLVAHACKNAAADAKVDLADIDLLIGSASVSGCYAPNDLCDVHHQLGLSAGCRVMTLNTDYTAFHDGLRIANDLITAGSARKALVACGNNWTHHVDYHEAVAMAASDAAGAAVVGATDDTSRFTLIDWDNETDSAWFRALRMEPRFHEKHGDLALFTTPLMKIDEKNGATAVKTFGVPVPPKIIARMLARHGITSKDITLVAHQSSKSIYEAWNAAIQPAHYITTLEELGDMVSSSVPVNLAKCYGEISTRYLVLMGTGMEMHATALLYLRA
jgi:3-oxoacyl-[acyl-carrier-protein] synthase-3